MDKTALVFWRPRSGQLWIVSAEATAPALYAARVEGEDSHDLQGSLQQEIGEAFRAHRLMRHDVRFIIDDSSFIATASNQHPDGWPPDEGYGQVCASAEVGGGQLLVGCLPAATLRPAIGAAAACGLRMCGFETPAAVLLADLLNKQREDASRARCMLFLNARQAHIFCVTASQCAVRTLCFGTPIDGHIPPEVLSALQETWSACGLKNQLHELEVLAENPVEAAAALSRTDQTTAYPSRPSMPPEAPGITELPFPLAETAMLVLNGASEHRPLLPFAAERFEEVKRWRARAPWITGAAVLFAVGGAIALGQSFLAGRALDQRLHRGETDRARLQALVSDAHRQRELIDDLRVAEHGLSLFVETRDDWLGSLSELQTALASVGNVWIDTLHVAHDVPASGEQPGREATDEVSRRMVLRGRIIDRANPLERVSDETRRLAESVVGRIRECSFVGSILKTRFHADEPGLLRFEIEAVLEREEA